MMEGLVFILDQIGHTLATKQAEVERLQAENDALREALTRPAQPPTEALGGATQ